MDDGEIIGSYVACRKLLKPAVSATPYTESCLPALPTKGQTLDFPQLILNALNSSTQPDVKFSIEQAEALEMVFRQIAYDELFKITRLPDGPGTSIDSLPGEPSHEG